MGQIKHIHLLAHRITYESGNEEIVGAVMDITEARKSQETLQAAQTALAHASRVATLGEISATIAHEVNQPLAAIVANGQACLRFLRREKPDLNDVRGAVEWIVKDGNRAGEVIRRVRGLMKKADTEKAPLDVNDLVNEVAALLRRELAAQQVTPQLELAPSVPPIVADRIQLQQVIINLVMNGAEAMQAITDRSPRLVIRTYQDEARSGGGRRGGQRPRNRRRGRRPRIRSVLQHQARRTGHGPFDLPLDRRGPWRPIVVIRECRIRRHVPVRVATAPGECGVRRSIEVGK